MTARCTTGGARGRGAGRWGAAAALIMGLGAVAAVPLGAQTVVGRTLASATDAPLGGVFVTLIDEAGRQTAGFISRPDGGFLIRAPGPGRYVLRAELIGYGSIERWVELSEGTMLPETLRLPLQAVELEGIVARASRQRDCSLRSEEGQALERLWSEARKGLRIAEWAGETGWLRANGYTYQRVLELAELEVLAESVVPVRSLGRRAFEAADPDSVRSGGFVVATGDGGTLYQGADATLLLSDAFMETHCFGLTERAEEGLVGLTFEPVPGRSVPDIEGVLWIEASTARLRTLEYAYTRYPVNYPLPRSRFGGRTAFRHLPGGGVAVEEWWIRMPTLREEAQGESLLRIAWRCGTSDCDDPGTLRSLSRAGLAIEEEGGRVLSFRLADGTVLPDAEQAAIVGIVLDSTLADSPAPLAGAEVTLRGTEHRAVTDARGRFRLDPLPEGTYRVEFHHPRLVEIGIERPEPMLVQATAGRAVSARLATPSRSTLAALRCEARSAPGEPATAILHGVVRDAATGATVGGARVRLVRASDPADRRGRAADGNAGSAVEAETDPGGAYLFCDLPPGPFLLAADFLGRGRHEVRVVPTSTTPTRVDVDLVLSTAARLLGRVVSVREEEGVAGVVVRIRDTGQAALTDESGHFTFDSISPGALRLETSHMAYRPSEGAVAVSGGETVRVEIRVAEEVLDLPPLVVTARARPLLMPERMRGFYSRQARGLGTFIGREQLVERPAARVTDVLRDVPFLRVTSTGGRSTIIRGRKAGGAPVAAGIGTNKNPYCFPMIYLDGTKLSTRTEALADLHEVINIIDNIPASQIAGIEAYSGAASIPGEFAGLDTACGVIAVWTDVSDHSPAQR